MSINLYLDLKILKEFLRFRGALLMLYVLNETGESYKEELTRMTGSQEASDKAIAWLLRMKMITHRKPDVEDERCAGYYSLTPNGKKIAQALNEWMDVVRVIHASIPNHKNW